MNAFDSLMTDKSLVSYLSDVGLMPYLYDITRKASLNHISCLFSMQDCFPQDSICCSLEGQYMIGNQLLVIPVHHRGASIEYYLPAGIWTNYLTGKTLIGPVWNIDTVTSSHPFLFIRENTILPTSIKEMQGYSKIQFRIYHLQDTLRISDIFYDQYTSKYWPYLIRRNGYKLTISSDSNMLYSFRIMNQKAESSDQAFLFEEGNDTIVQPDYYAAIITTTLQPRKDKRNEITNE